MKYRTQGGKKVKSFDPIEDMIRGIQRSRKDLMNLGKRAVRKPQPLQFMSTTQYPRQQVPPTDQNQVKQENNQSSNHAVFVDMKPSTEHFSLDPKYPEPQMIKVATR